MKLEEFLGLDEGGYISPDEAAELNRDLAATKLCDIASADRQNVLDYLLKAMEFNSVEHDIRGNIDDLINDLQTAS